MAKYKTGDKFVIEIDSVMTNKNGLLYGIKGFKSLVFDEYGLDLLREIEMSGGKRDGMRVIDRQLFIKESELKASIYKVAEDLLNGGAFCVVDVVGNEEPQTK